VEDATTLSWSSAAVSEWVMCCMRWRLHQQSVQYDSAQQNISMLSYRMVVWNCECNRVTEACGN